MHTIDIYRHALQFAAKAHQGQKIPASELPYLLHIAEVMTETMEALAKRSDLDAKLGVLAAILHDTIEDTPVKLEDLENQYGRKVAQGVWALTKDENLPKEQQMADSIQKIKKQPHEIWCVKLADRIVNMQEPPSYWTAERRKKYYDEAKFILQELGKADKYLQNRLQEKIIAYEAFL